MGEAATVQSTSSEAAEAPAYRLEPAALRLSVLCEMQDRRKRRTTGKTLVGHLQHVLWREDPQAVAAIADEVMLRGAGLDFGDGQGRHGLRAERMRELHRPLPTRNRRGMTVPAMAALADVDRETMARALEHHGYLELAPFGGRQSRRLVSDRAFAAGYGHNVDSGGSRIGHLEGFNRACVFPVFYPEHVAAILWTLEFDRIRSHSASLPTKRKRLQWLLTAHAYLPAASVAALAGCTTRAVEKARARAVPESSVASYQDNARTPPMRNDHAMPGPPFSPANADHACVS